MGSPDIREAPGRTTAGSEKDPLSEVVSRTTGFVVGSENHTNCLKFATSRTFFHKFGTTNNAYTLASFKGFRCSHV